MKYAINQIVKVLETNQIKVISDYENIEGVKIYYMTDNSAFAESQLQELSLEELIETLKQKLPILLEPLVKESAERTAEGFKKLTEQKKLEELQEKLLKKQLKKEKWNKLFNKLKKFFLLK